MMGWTKLALVAARVSVPNYQELDRGGDATSCHQLRSDQRCRSPFEQADLLSMLIEHAEDFAGLICRLIVCGHNLVALTSQFVSIVSIVNHGKIFPQSASLAVMAHIGSTET